MNLREYYDGKEFHAYEFMGAHCVERGVVFRTYAPAASAVSVIGEFNDWTDTPCHRVENGQFWEVWIENAKAGQMYKFRIYQQGGAFKDHADPYAFYSEMRPGTASVIYDRRKYHFHDEAWMKQRSEMWDQPLNIYEMHLGSWRRKGDPMAHAAAIDAAKNAGKGIDVSDGWYRYEEIAEMLIPYLKKHHYNAVEFLPLSEYPADESWGYQTAGFFSATARYGDPDGLKKLIDRCHEEGIRVILDIVCVHFVTNDYALWKYDGSHLYEYPNDAVGKSEWGSCNFEHSRGDVCSFLNSASHFWLNDYHFDGLRFDAVGNLIYWQGDVNRGVNYNTVRFIQNMNMGLKAAFPGVMLIAEDSSAYDGVTRPVFAGGLGFDYKWDMGWMNDTLKFFQIDPQYRPENYHKLTFSMSYFYNEKYLMPFSHDEVVHGKATILQKMAGNYEMKFPQGRALYLYMYTHPGKKLNFMGNEIGQFREWDEKREQDWSLLDYPIHRQFHDFIVELSDIYEKQPSLWEKDYEREGFEWVEADAVQQCIYAFIRKSAGGKSILCMFNFSGQPQRFTYRPAGKKKLELLVDTDDKRFGGNTDYGNQKSALVAEHETELLLPAFSGRAYLMD